MDDYLTFGRKTSGSERGLDVQIGTGIILFSDRLESEGVAMTQICV